LRYKPAGRAANLDYLARRLTEAQARALGPTLRALSAAHAGDDFHLRIDCALVPFLSADPSIDAAALETFGVLGCEAAQALSAVRADGRVAPCSFAPPTDLAARALRDGLASDPTLHAWRTHHETPPEPCASCSLRPVCKGGCKVVAAFAGDGLGPDPECPRVRAFRRGDA
jgi:radical SAM protein with 4Fe4S-binding SPASM domain